MVKVSSTKSSMMRALAEQARMGVANPEPSVVENKEVVVEDTSNHLGTGDGNEEKRIDNLEKWIEKASEFKTSSNSYVYVDDEIKGVISLLCSKHKIDVKNLVSVIVENWIKDNKTEISRSLSQGNRYL